MPHLVISTSKSSAAGEFDINVCKEACLSTFQILLYSDIVFT